MGDAFSPQKCTLSYLKSEVIHLRHLVPQTTSDDICVVLRLYERELLSRGLKFVSTPDGEMIFQPVPRRSVYLDQAETGKQKIIFCSLLSINLLRCAL